MIRKSGCRFSEKIMLQQKNNADSSRYGRAFPEPLLDQRGRSLAHADAEPLAGDTGLDDLELRAVAHEPFGYRRELHEGVAAAGRQIVERVADLVIGVDTHARRTMLGNELVGD